VKLLLSTVLVDSGQATNAKAKEVKESSAHQTDSVSAEVAVGVIADDSFSYMNLVWCIKLF